MNICLTEMTKELAHRYFQGFEVDPALFSDDQAYSPYTYRENDVNARLDRYRQIGRVYLAVLLNSEPIGEIVLKDIDYTRKYCTLGISLQSDRYKNKGYGTTAEILSLEYAFNNLDMQTVFADSLVGNTRSQHVLQKVGFHQVHRDEMFIYYRCDRTDWIPKLDP